MIGATTGWGGLLGAVFGAAVAVCSAVVMDIGKATLLPALVVGAGVGLALGLVLGAGAGCIAVVTRKIGGGRTTAATLAAAFVGGFLATSVSSEQLPVTPIAVIPALMAGITVWRLADRIATSSPVE